MHFFTPIILLKMLIFHCHVTGSFGEGKLIFLDLHHWCPAFRADQPQVLNDWMRLDFPIHRVLMEASCIMERLSFVWVQFLICLCIYVCILIYCCFWLTVCIYINYIRHLWMLIVEICSLSAIKEQRFWSPSVFVWQGKSNASNQKKTFPQVAHWDVLFLR